ncbi:PilN domain-containing protein [Porticoccus sp.]
MELKPQQQGMDKLKQFLSWWQGELRQVVPGAVGQFFTRQSSTLTILLEQNIARFQLRTEKTERLLGVLDLMGCSDQVLQTFRQESLSDLPGGLTVEIYLSSEQLLVSEQCLPLATEANLGNVLNFEIDRLTPFHRDQVVFGYLPAGRFPEREKIKVELYSLPRKTLDALLSRTSMLGLLPDTVYPAQTQIRAPAPTLNLLPLPLRPAVEPLWNNRAKQLGLVSLILALALVLFPLYQLNSQIDSLEQQVADIRGPATIVGNKQSLLASRLAAQDTLVLRKNHMSSQLAIVQEVTRIMPDNTWVSRLRADGSGVNLQGESRKASDLIELLEKSERFQNVQFVSPITANPSTNMERYEIKMELAEMSK